MCESLKLHQGPGLNGMFLTADPLSQEYDAQSNVTKYTLRPDYTLYIRGNLRERPGGVLLKSDTLKLLDILVSGLEDSKVSRWVEVTLEEFCHLTRHAITEGNKNDVRSRLKGSAELLGALSMDWTEKDGRYIHRGVKLFDEITYRNGRICACFSEAMALYLRGCPSMPLPLPLLAVSGKSPHSYPLGRRCLVHNAVNKGQERQTIRVRSLLAVCPRIPRAEPGEKWSPSILERKVIEPFTAAMNTLATLNILTWKFQEPVCRNDYDGFSDSMVEFQVQAEGAVPVSPMPADCSDTKREYGPFNYKAFLSIR